MNLKPIKGYEGIYEVSDDGRVFACERIKKSVNQCGKYNATSKRKELKAATSYKGYQYVVLYKNGEKRTHKIHRLVAINFIPNPKNKPEVNHKNGIKNDNQRKNLEWVTASENEFHAYRTGLKTKIRPKRTKHVLTKEKMIEIKKIKKTTLISNRKIAKLYNVSAGTINNIFTGKSWIDT